MRYLCIIIFIIIGSLNLTYSQTFWEELYFPDTVSIQCFTINDEGHIFVGVGANNEAGAIYRSTDSAQSWDVVFDNGTHGVLSIEINEAGDIYAGKNGFDRLAVSYDNGENWVNIEPPPPCLGNIMKIHCKGTDTVYVGSWENEGSFITFSFDGGMNWEHSWITKNHNEYVSDIDIRNTGEIFVSTSGFFYNQGGVYRSIDDGFKWDHVGLLNHQVLTLEVNSKNEVFTGDWWVLNNDVFGIHGLYEKSDTFNLIFDAFHVTDIEIDTNDYIYSAANESVVCSYDNGQSFEYIDDPLSSNLEYLHIGPFGHLFGTRIKRLVKSIEPLITGTKEGIDNVSGYICIYPNPAEGILNLSLKSGFNERFPSEILIYDVLGNLICSYMKVLTEERCQLNINHLTQGLYFIKIIQGNLIYNSIFIKINS